ncbi:hypothetical protein ATO12_09775 [Aquimarina atlantica]|uniref:Uncharacterized protein n=1 Tax=Aquimarina atlantica TaxID=1317122 RepID=A0A023BYI3_9FLAO|nr:hypothetical protein ATO12_09775 [Aquimarina atlantica]
MIDKRDIFFKKQLDNLPFFLRNHKIKELQVSKNSSEVTVSYNDQFPVYHSETVECNLSLKPISKLLTFDEQKEF